MGGMNFRCFESLNQAMLMKQLWRIINHPELFISKIYKKKYFREENLLDINSKHSDSFAWKCLSKVKKMFFAGVREGDDHMRVKWKYSSDGIYTVKKGYEFAFQWRDTPTNLAGESSNTELFSRLWKKFWRLRIPESAKIFAWRLYYDALPVFPKLRKRGCEIKVNCCVCGFEEESISHLFFKCWWSISVWNSLNIGWHEAVEMSAREWLWYIILEKSIQTQKTAVIAAWLIWKNRNLIAHDKEGWFVELCVLKIKSLIAQFDKKKLIGQSQVQESLINPMNKIIIWCDGSWNHYDDCGGFAAVATYEDLTLGVSASFKTNCSSVLECELKSIWCGLKLADDLNLKEVTIVSDSSEAIWTIYKGDTSHSALAGIINQCLKIILTKPKWSVHHVLREFNIVADYLAKYARSKQWRWNNLDSIPKITAEARMCSTL